MKHYLYISRDKVDMLYSQIPRSLLKQIAGELKIDLGALGVVPLSVTLRKSEAPEEPLTQRLKIVERYLDKTSPVGSVDAPDQWFRGVMALRWGHLGLSVRPQPKDPLIFFSGLSTKSVVGLGGSKKHVIGQTDSGSSVEGSLVPFLVEGLVNQQRRPKPPEGGPDVETLALQAIELEAASKNRPSQRLDFLAVKLLEGETSRVTTTGQDRVLLGSPLYVALA